VARAEQWEWSSARHGQTEAARPSYLVAGPVLRPRRWLEWVNQPLTAGELEALRRCVNRGTPFGASVSIAALDATGDLGMPGLLTFSP
jgi:hypothetical protein